MAVLAVAQPLLARLIHLMVRQRVPRRIMIMVTRRQVVVALRRVHLGVAVAHQTVAAQVAAVVVQIALVVGAGVAEDAEVVVEAIRPLEVTCCLQYIL